MKMRESEIKVGKKIEGKKKKNRERYILF